MICPKWGGDGKVWRVDAMPPTNVVNVSRVGCPRCGGTGKVDGYTFWAKMARIESIHKSIEESAKEFFKESARPLPYDPLSAWRDAVEGLDMTGLEGDQE